MIWDTIFQPFAEFGFMRRALLGCIAISVGATPVGTFLMLRRMSLTGDAMAHAILPGAAIGFLVFGLSLIPMTIGGLTAGLLVALLSGFVTRMTILREDASLAAFYLISLAIGVLIVSTRGSNVDLMHVLFGTVLALDDATLILLCSISSFSLITLSLSFRPLVLGCADPQFLRSVSGLPRYRDTHGCRCNDSPRDSSTFLGYQHWWHDCDCSCYCHDFKPNWTAALFPLQFAVWACNHSRQRDCLRIVSFSWSNRRTTNPNNNSTTT